ncbi:MAG: universal stress protein [Myxococcales bacterium]|nr:universal stress protein [Myxococcales bacterium]
MTRIDQFESVFRAAAKPRFQPAPIQLGRVLVVTDLDASEGAAYTARVRGFLAGVTGAEAIDWREVHGEADTVGHLLQRVQDEGPDLVVTYRNLHSGAFRWPHTLGDHAEVLTQVTNVPVLLLPRPDFEGVDALLENTDRVMVLTDHLSGDDHLVHYGVAFAAPGGVLFLVHVEDNRTFDRYIEIISKIPTIDTDNARATIADRLLKEAQDYAQSCADALKAADVPLEVRIEVTLGHHLSVFRRLVRDHKIDLLVLNTKDDDQLAMHGLAYPLAVELRDVPMLML